jgi:hypothetical protein
MTIQRMPAARQIQIGFLGRLEAIRALTNGKAGEDKRKMSTALPPPVHQLLGDCTDRAATYNAMLTASSWLIQKGSSLAVAPMRFTLYDSCKTVRGIRNRPLVGFA